MTRSEKRRNEREENKKTPVYNFTQEQLNEIIEKRIAAEIDKAKRLEDKKRREKFMSVADKRRKAWEEEAKKRNELLKEEKKIEIIHEDNDKKVEHEFWIEEIMKTEEFLQEAGSF